MPDFQLNDKAINVTAGGIGEAMSRDFAAAGAAVVLASRTEDKLKAVADDLGNAKTLVVSTDVTDPDSVQNLIDCTVSEFGRLDVIVNSAGGGVTPPTETEDGEKFRDWHWPLLRKMSPECVTSWHLMAPT